MLTSLCVQEKTEKQNMDGYKCFYVFNLENSHRRELQCTCRHGSGSKVWAVVFKGAAALLTLGQRYCLNVLYDEFLMKCSEKTYFEPSMNHSSQLLNPERDQVDGCILVKHVGSCGHSALPVKHAQHYAKAK